MKEVCGNCKYRKDDECHRYPPQIIPFGIDGRHQHFPFVLIKDSCGEFTPKKESTIDVAYIIQLKGIMRMLREAKIPTSDTWAFEFLNDLIRTEERKDEMD